MKVFFNAERRLLPRSSADTQLQCMAYISHYLVKSWVFFPYICILHTSNEVPVGNIHCHKDKVSHSTDMFAL